MARPDEGEARAALKKELARWREVSSADLVARIGEPECSEVPGESGTRYQVEIEAFWDHRKGGNIRVLGSVDRGGIFGSIFPASDDFIKAPNGEIVGE